MKLKPLEPPAKWAVVQLKNGDYGVVRTERAERGRIVCTVSPRARALRIAATYNHERDALAGAVKPTTRANKAGRKRA